MLKIGEVVFDKYRVLKLLGKGGMGSVYLAENINVGNLWAIKEINYSAGNPVDLLAEPDILKRLKHPHMPRIVDVIRTDCCIYIVEDYFEGQNLRELLKNRQVCTEANVLKWARQLAEILIYLHNLKPAPIIYRDLKPGNIIIDENNNLKLVDFGIAREYKEGATRSLYGSRGYAAPEQYRGKYDERTDIYGFGATFYHVLTGVKYDHARPVRLKEINKNFSEGIDFIIDKCLKEDPAQRYQSAAELYKDLKFIHKFNIDYKKSRIKQKLVIAGVIFSLAAGVFAVKLGIEQRELTNIKLFQQKIDEGISLCAKGQYAEAERAFYEALKYEQDVEVYQNLARMYLRKNEPQRAINLLIDKIQKGEIKEDAASFYLLGSAYFDLMDYANAAWYFQKSIQTNPFSLGENYELAMRDLAVSYGRMGRYDEAREVLKTIEERIGSTSHVTSYVLGEFSLAKKNYHEALRYYNQAQAGDPKNIRYKLSTARLYSLLSAGAQTQHDKEEKLKSAISILKEAEAIDPYNIQVLSDYGKFSFDLGEFYQSTGNPACTAMYQQALLAFNKLKDIGIANANTFLNIAIISDKLNNYGAAEKAFKEALRLDEGDSHTNFVYGLFKLKHKEYSEAYKYLQKTVDLNKNSYEVSVARTKINELREKGWI